jgi:glyoxylase-like metal-dependent hydrolase (beta-lactamase superfamily II)
MHVRTETSAHPLPDGEVRLLGAVHTVTGAMTRVDLAGAKLLVDCGVAQGRDARAWSFPDDALDADAVVLTHGHNDHVGSLPELWRRGWSGPVLGTAATLAIARIVLADGLRLQHARRDVDPLRSIASRAATPRSTSTTSTPSAAAATPRASATSQARCSSWPAVACAQAAASSGTCTTSSRARRSRHRRG